MERVEHVIVACHALGTKADRHVAQRGEASVLSGRCKWHHFLQGMRLTHPMPRLGALHGAPSLTRVSLLSRRLVLGGRSLQCALHTREPFLAPRSTRLGGQ